MLGDEFPGALAQAECPSVQPIAGGLVSLPGTCAGMGALEHDAELVASRDYRNQGRALKSRRLASWYRAISSSRVGNPDDGSIGTTGTA